MNLFLIHKKHYPFTLLLLGTIFFFPFLGHVHLFDWDEINFAESSREMLESGDYFHVQINYQPFIEKPPLVMWLQSACMQVFGVNEFAARFPNALFGVITLLSLFYIGKKQKNEEFGFIWAMLYLMSFLPHIYFKSGIIDPIFNYFIFLGIYFLFKTLFEQNIKWAIAGGFFTGLAILSKGPVALLLVLLTYVIYQILTRFRHWGTFKLIFSFTITCAVISFIWILPEIKAHGFAVLGDFIEYQIRLLTTGDAGHEQPFYYHFVVVFIGCFPMSFFAVPLFKSGSFPTQIDFTKAMAVLFWVVLILFTIVKTKIVHYSSMCWLPMSYCAAVYFSEHGLKNGLSKSVRVLFLIFGVLFSLLLILVPIAGYYRLHLIPYIKDKFAVACLQMEVPWALWTCIWGLLLLFAVVFGFVLLKKNRWGTFITVQSIITATVLFGFLLTVVPNIEQHSQRPAIEFYESKAGQRVYVWPMGFRSYAHHFYFKVPMENNLIRQNEDQLFRGEVDRPVFFITKANNDFLDNRPEVKLLYKKGGFKFYERQN